MTQQSQLSTEILRLIDEGIESLRWCWQHLEERSAVERMRRLQITLAGLALALDYEMDGQHSNALLALERANWQSKPAVQFTSGSNAWPGWDEH